jgi:hypothetical protein
MHEYGSLPQARKGGLLEETVGDELLLYDQDSHTAHCLSAVVACVWRHCDGERNTTELAELAGVSESLVADALRALRVKDLLAAEPVLAPSAVRSVSRREALGQVVRYGAAAAAGSMIVSATAATPAMASSGETLMCCQCRKANDEICACIVSSSILTNTACNNYCLKEPVGCASGALTGTVCGAGNICK